MKSFPNAVFDASAVLPSGLCLVHCLALPLLVSLLPLFGRWIQAEWVHVVFVAIAVPLTTLALWCAHRQRPLPRPLWAMAVLGLSCLAVGAAGLLGEWAETGVTVVGSLLLAGAHLWNWRRHLRHAQAGHGV